MKLWTIIAGICSVLFLFNSCNEDFQLTENWKDIPVVYGFINRLDTAHYVRVEKVFVDENKSAKTIAQIVDSLYYPNAVVKIINRTTKREVILKRVDGNLEGFQRRAGDFATAPNYLYKYYPHELVMNGGDSLQFELNRGDGKKPVTANIKILSNIKMTNPSQMDKSLSFNPKASTTYSWSIPEARVYSIDMDITVTEFNNSTNTKTEKKIHIPINDQLFSSTVTFRGLSFFESLKSNLTVDNQIRREIFSVDLTVKAAGPELYSFLEIVNANTGVTASQEIPRYTNMSEGFGIFSSTTSTVSRFGITPETISELKNNELTRDLNFY